MTLRCAGGSLEVVKAFTGELLWPEALFTLCRSDKGIAIELIVIKLLMASNGEK